MGTLWGIQYLRAVAALSVLLFHAALGAGGQHALGTGGVDIFFVLSGFLMFQIADRDPTPARFALDRVRRIVPAYWLVTLIVVATQLLGLTERSSFDPAHVVRSLLFLPSYDAVRHEIYPLLIVGWTLNYEMFFYSIVTALLFFPRPTRILLLVATFAGLFILRAVTPNPGVALTFYSDTIILEFVCGALISSAWRVHALPARGWWLVVLGALLMLAPQITAMPRFISYGVPAAMILMGVLAEERDKPLPQFRKLKLLGDASYSIYLWHLFVVAAVFRLFGTSPPVFLLAVVGGVVAGIAFYWIIERPTMAIFKPRRLITVT